MKIELKNKANTDYLLVFLLVAVSGIPFFDGDIPLIGAFGVAFLVFLLRREGFHRFYFFILFSFVVLVLLHSLRENYFPQNTYIGLVIKITLAYFVVASVGKSFTNIFTNIIVFFSLISFFFFIPLFISPSFDNIFNSIGVPAPFEPGTVKSVIIYNFNLGRPGGLYRNCGPFWEPAAFGGYLLIALMFNMAHQGKLNGKKNIILIITLLSTLSTTVFLLLGVLIFFYVLLNQSVLIKILTVPTIAILAIVVFTQVPFLQEKIKREWERGDMSYEMRKSDKVGHTRLSSAIADYQDFIKYPVIGRGLFDPSFFDYRETKTRHNGLTRQIAQFGIIGSLIYFLSICVTMVKLVRFSSLKKFLGVIFFLIILGMGISEGYFEKPFFWGLVFLHLFLYSSNESIQKNKVNEQIYA